MPKVILVNEKDELVGTMEKLEAHQKGLLHRAFSIFIFNRNGQLLLQQRALDKYHCGGLWSNTCCSHPEPGEDILDAANRRLMEEMGLSTKLEEAFTFSYTASFANGLTENEIDHVFIGFDDSTPIPDPIEVANWRYIDPEIAFKESVEMENEYTPWFRIAMPKVILAISEKRADD